MSALGRKYIQNQGTCQVKESLFGIIDFILVFSTDKIRTSSALYGLIFKFYDNFDAKSIDYGTG